MQLKVDLLKTKGLDNLMSSIVKIFISYVKLSGYLSVFVCNLNIKNSNLTSIP